MNRGSLTSKILGLMLTLILLSSGLALFAIANLSYSLGDARAVNASGSLRMQSYRLMLYTHAGKEQLQAKIQEFETTLNSDALKRSQDWTSPERLRQQYLLVQNKWQHMKQLAMAEDSGRYGALLQDFVDTIDLLVLETELHAAFKLKLLAASQAMGLGLMLLVAFFAVRYTRRKVVVPLQQLMHSANTIAKGNFDVQLPETEYLELQALTHALDSTAKELSALYGDLEHQVQEKTRALSRANGELALLYDTLVMLHGKQPDYRALKPALDKLKQFEAMQYLRLRISHGDEQQEIITADGGWPEEALAQYHIPLTFEGSVLGKLECISARPCNGPLLENFALILARSLLLYQASEQKQQLALMEERGVIARELHDSLGQVLSYLKIQLNLLRKGLDDCCLSPQVEQQLSEINEGVSAAYVQLRELLSTFRLTIKEPNLQHALEAMLEQLRNQTSCEIVLDYGLEQQLLGANQHIHILQLTREATLNAIKHAQAKRIEICCCKNDAGLINISISDDGIGINHLRERDNHFGIGIMQERAAKLSGRLNFSGNAAGGATVSLTLPPHQETNHG
ncbi:nitrate/nitrite two-component system sensor histidine kinase NarQ [Shewanella cyperi]|uniref:Sensor protein n=1 Tax=Shewanella cyperi TaxID=2814292 RepID=A0A974XS22_9GAMM|nr:nitrate/nitrite two-component system sensor histidine kinase NarQ [Shewanella cyperi]QSX29439.1 nitrate/nitrite two-component system sensor histidine kinase NarQ [Shewanella cyperi]